MRGLTYYSEEVKGTRANWSWKAKFDKTDGVVGITQWCDDKVERVLLSQAQIDALIKFLGKPRIERALRS